MRLDLFLRVRRDRFNLAIRLRLIAGAAIIASIVLVLTGTHPARLLERDHLPVIMITPLPAYGPPVG